MFAPPKGTRRLDALLIGVQAGLGLAMVAAVAFTADPGASARWRETVAWVLALVAMAVGGSALVAMRRSFRIAPTPREDGVLVEHGIYRRMRHPMYTAVLLCVAAITLHQPGPATIATAGLNLAFYLAKARYEERLLLARYPAYARYRARTWGVIPGC